MLYRDEIIQISGGLNDYIGKLDQTVHPMGEGWYRIKEACLVYYQKNKEGKIGTVVNRASGPPGHVDYRNHVDIYIPDCVQMEIKTLKKDGPLYKFYKEQVAAKEPTSIILPQLGIVSGKPQ